MKILFRRIFLFGFILFGAYSIGGAADISINKETVVYIPGQSKVHETAITEIALSLGISNDMLHIVRSANINQGSVFVGVLKDLDLKQRTELILSGKINLHNISAEIDGFELLMYNNILWVLGSNSRGMLQGVYELQEVLRAGEKIGEDFHREGDFSSIPQRIFHPRFNKWPGSRADVRYISHLGATHCLMTHDWQGDHRHFQQYIKSEIFPNAMKSEQVEEKHRQLRELIEDCKDYGLEPALWITELPCQGGAWVNESTRQEFLTHYLEDVLSECGTYQGKVLCFSHPKVQEYYRELVTGFFKDFPEVSLLFVFGLDAGGEFCDPKQCSRCKGMSKFSQRDRFLKFLIEEGTKLRPGLRVLTTSWGWQDINSEEFLRRQTELPEESGLFMAAQSDGWQMERQNHDFLKQARQICKEKNQWFIGYDNLHWGDDTEHRIKDIQDFPLGIAAKLARWDRLKVDGVFDHWGTYCEEISCNSVACREFFMNPRADREGVCRNIAEKQFGKQAGPLVYLSWQALENAHRILSNGCVFAPGQWPNWYNGREYPPIPDVFSLKKYSQQCSKGNIANGWIYNNGEKKDQFELIGKVWRLAWPYYQEAIGWMDKAVDKADEEELFYAYWWSGKEPSPTRKEHLQKQKLYLESMGLIGREIGLHFSLMGLYELLNRDAEMYRKKAKNLLIEDAEACRRCVSFFEQVALNLNVPDEDKLQVQSYVVQYINKANAIDNYLLEKEEE